MAKTNQGGAYKSKKKPGPKKGGGGGLKPFQSKLTPPAPIDLNIGATEADLKKARKEGKAAATGQLATIAGVVGKNLGKQSGKHAQETSKVLRNMKRIEQRNRLFQANRQAGAAATRQAMGGPSGSAGAVGTARDAMIVGRRQRMLSSQEKVAGDTLAAGTQAGKTVRSAGRAAVDAGPGIDMTAQRGTMSILDVLAAERQSDDVRFTAQLQHEQDMANQQFEQQKYLTELGFEHDQYMAKLNDKLSDDRELKEEKKGQFRQGAHLFQRAMVVGNSAASQAMDSVDSFSEEQIAAAMEMDGVVSRTNAIRNLIKEQTGIAGETPEGVEYVVNSAIDHVIDYREAPSQEQMLQWAEVGDDTGEIGRLIKKRPDRVKRILGRASSIEMPTRKKVRTPDGDVDTDDDSIDWGVVAKGSTYGAVGVGAWKAGRKLGKEAHRITDGKSFARGAGAHVSNEVTRIRNLVGRMKGERVIISPHMDASPTRAVRDELVGMAKYSQDIPRTPQLPAGPQPKALGPGGPTSRADEMLSRGLISKTEHAEEVYNILGDKAPERIRKLARQGKTFTSGKVFPWGPIQPDEIESMEDLVNRGQRIGSVDDPIASMEDAVNRRGVSAADDPIASMEAEVNRRKAPRQTRLQRDAATTRKVTSDVAEQARKAIDKAKKAGNADEAARLTDKYKEVLKRDRLASKVAPVADRVAEVRIADVIESQSDRIKNLGLGDDIVMEINEALGIKAANSAKTVDAAIDAAARAGDPSVGTAIERFNDPAVRQQAVKAIESSGGKFVGRADGTLEFVPAGKEVPKGSKVVRAADAFKRLARSPGTAGKVLRGAGTVLRIVGTAGAVYDTATALSEGTVFGIPIGPAAGQYGKALGLVSEAQAQDLADNYRGIPSAIDATREARGYHEDSYHATARMVMKVGQNIGDIRDPSEYHEWLKDATLNDSSFNEEESWELYQYGVKALRRYYESQG